MGSVQLGVKALRDEKRAIVIKAMAGITSKGLMRPTPRKSRVITWGNAAKLGIASAKNLEG
jgi:hypothetical protein